MFLMVYKYGGHASPAFPAAPTIPVASVLFLRRGGRVICVTAVLAGVALIYGLYLAGFTFPYRVPMDKLQRLFVITMLVTGIYVSMMMVTGNADATSVKTAKEFGVNAYVSKPFTPQQMQEKISALANRLRAAA